MDNVSLVFYEFECLVSPEHMPLILCPNLNHLTTIENINMFYHLWWMIIPPMDLITNNQLVGGYHCSHDFLYGFGMDTQTTKRSSDPFVTLVTSWYWFGECA
jgi:hypothetical protein